MRSGSLPSLCTLLVSASIALVAPGCGGDAPDLLLVAPFAEGVAATQDDPDTLRTALRPVVGRLSLVPRGDSGPRQVAAAVAEDEPQIVWLRLAQDPAPWLRALPFHWGGLVVHSVALAHGGVSESAWEGTEEEDGIGAGRVLLRARPGTGDVAVAAYARALLREWRLGATLRDANEAAAAATRRPPWTLVGNDQLTLDDLHVSREARSSED